MTNEHEFHLIDNALDYVLSAAEHATHDNARNLKYAILHLFAGVELLLKARLLEEHWSLLFADTDKASRQALRSGDFRSADFGVVVQRLAKIASVNLDKNDIVVLESLRNLRNKIQHYGATLNKPQIQSQIGYAANFINDFVENHLSSVRTSHPGQLDEIWTVLQGCNAFVDERMKSIAAALAQFEDIWSCPMCNQDAVPIGESDTPECLFCGYAFDPEEFAVEHSRGGDVHECPSCDYRACTLVLHSNDDSSYKCFCCGESFDCESYDLCMLCNERLVTDEDGTVCSECYTAKVRSDD